MLKTKLLKVTNVDVALRGMRNPLESWAKSDSTFNDNGLYLIGPNDLKLCKNLINAGSDHRKFIRQITIAIDIEAPLYWWKEFDTYKVGTTANSTSTMHTIHKKEFSRDMFSCEHMTERMLSNLDRTIEELNYAREQYLETKDKQFWWDMIQMLPSSFTQIRTVTMSLETFRNIYFSRKNHKLPEWKKLIEAIIAEPICKLAVYENISD